MSEEKGVLRRILYLIIGLFVAVSMQLANYMFTSITSLNAVTVDSPTRRIIIAAVWSVIAALVVLIARLRPAETFRLLTIRHRSQSWVLPVNTLLCFIGGICLNRMTTFIIGILPLSDKVLQENSGAVSSAMESNSGIIIIISTYIVAPLFEELIYRGSAFYCLENVFDGKGGYIFAFVSTTVLFSLAHSGVLQMTYAFVIGAIFCLISRFAGSIIPAIAAHVGFNLGNLMLYAIIEGRDDTTQIVVNVACGIILIIAAAAMSVTCGFIREREELPPEPGEDSIYLNEEDK